MDTRPIGSSKRTLGGRDFFVLWAGVAISLAEIWAGGFLAPMGFGVAMWAIIIGHLIGNTLMAAGGLMGSDHGIMSMVSVRPSFGLRGSNLAALLNVVQLVCWRRSCSSSAGAAGAMLGEPLGGIWASSELWIVAIGLGTLAWALLTGHPAWKLMQTVAVLGLLAVIAVLSWQTYGAFETGERAAASAEPMPSWRASIS